MQFSTSKFGPHASTELHARPFAYISVVLGGSYEEAVGSVRIECLPLSLRLHPAGEEHTHRFGVAGARCLNLELPYTWQSCVDRVLDASTKPLMVEPRSRSRAAIMSLIECVDDEAIVLEELAATLLDLCEQQASLDQAPIRSRAMKCAIDRINDELPHAWSLTQLAAEANLHPTHFARSFKAITGHTVGQYVRLRRCAYAQRLLATDRHASISRIAAASGFADHAHFTRTLRAVAGVSPSEYRSLLRNA